MKTVYTILVLLVVLLSIVNYSVPYSMYYDTHFGTLSLYSYSDAVDRDIIIAEYEISSLNASIEHLADPAILYLARGKFSRDFENERMRYSDDFILKFDQDENLKFEFDYAIGDKSDTLLTPSSFRLTNYVPEEIRIVKKDLIEIARFKLSKEYSKNIKNKPVFSLIEEWVIVWAEAMD